MRRRNREIQIFNLSMLDVISGAMGAFLIVMVVLLPSYRKTSSLAIEEDDPAQKESLRAQVEELRAETVSLKRDLERELQARANLERQQGRGGAESEKFLFLMATLLTNQNVPAPIECTIGHSGPEPDISTAYRPGRPWLMATPTAFQLVRPRQGVYSLSCRSLTGGSVQVRARASWSGGGTRDGQGTVGPNPTRLVAVEVSADGSVR